MRTFVPDYDADGYLLLFSPNRQNYSFSASAPWDINNTDYDIKINNFKSDLFASLCISIGSISFNSGKITSFSTKQPFHAVDRNDSSWVSAQAMPSNKYIDLELGATGTQYTAPANGWFHIAKVAGTADAHCTLVNTCVTGTEAQGGNYTIRMQASTNGMTIYLNLPVKKGDVAVINYTASGNTDAFRFIYAEGEN